MQKESTPFWLVWSPSGFAPKFKHLSSANAELEAIRLARLCPGQEFYVLEPVSLVKKTDVEIKWFDPAQSPF